VRVESLILRMRTRSPLDAADLGVRLAQANAKSVYYCYAIVAAPIMAIALATHEIAIWLPPALLWWSKPWLDRTILFVLSRAAFGQPTSPRDLWQAQGTVWWHRLLLTWTWRRASPWRSLTQPVYQLEGLSLVGLPPRLKQIRRRTAGSALLVTSAFGLAESALVLGVASLLVWFAPFGQGQAVVDAALSGGQGPAWLVMAAAYALAVLFLEPFFVAAGFGMYLNRRTELEAWDVEQELRRAFAA
jgi:hypothetical protein